MYAFAATIAANPPDAETTLNREQIWRGLVMKAEDAVPFVPAMEECHITERCEDGFIRQIKLRGMTTRERITFTPQVEVHFDRIDDPHHGWISNVLSDSAEGPLLTFIFALTFPGAAPGSPREREMGEAVRESYVAAIQGTLAETRRRVRVGTL